MANAILYPSKEIAPEWQGWYVQDSSGDVHQGMQIDVNLEYVELMNSSGEFDKYTDPTSNGVMKEFLMPANLHNELTGVEFNDLITYLKTLNSNY